MQTGWTLTDWEALADVVDHYVVSLAALVGGLWVLIRLRRERTDEAALDMTVSQQSCPFKNGHLVTIKVQLTNRGKTSMQAKTKPKPDDLAYSDRDEKLAHSCSLQIKTFETKEACPVSHIDWFKGPYLTEVAGLQEQINLLTEYEDPRNNDAVDFWMEPGETYCLTVPVMLPAGVYMGKVTFIGAKSDFDFWSQVFSFSVSDQATGCNPSGDDKKTLVPTPPA